MPAQALPNANARENIGNVITNYPIQLEPPIVSPEWVNWTDIVDHVGYDWAYTKEISAQYNEAQTPNHVVFNGQDIDFYGYYNAPFNYPMLSLRLKS